MMYARYGGEHQIEDRLGLMRRAARFGGYLLWPFIGAITVTILATIIRLIGPLVVRGGIDAGIDARDSESVTRAAIAFAIVLMLQWVAQRLSLYGVAWVGQRYLKDLRVRVFDYLMRLDVDYFARTKTGVIVSRMTADIEALGTFVEEGAVNIVTAMLTVIGVTVAMFFVDLQLAVFILLMVPFLVLASLVFRRYADRAYRRIREQIGHVLGSLQEGISGVRVVQAYTQEDQRADMFGRVNKDYYEANMSAARAIAVYFPTVDVFRTVGQVILLVVGGLRVIDGTLSFGSLVALLLYLSWFFEPVTQLSNTYNLLQSALAALSKLFGVLDRVPSVAEPPEPIVPEGEGAVRFTDVSFGYDAEVEILSGIDLSIAAGERVAVVGETGAGKSTIAKLAVRFYDPTSGRVTIDGVDLRSIGSVDLRRIITLVPQEGFLFSGSIRANIGYARTDMSDEEMWDVCRTIGVEDWVRSLPERLDTEVRERGSRLSSGERQLVALARALAADPRVIVLDEATSNLDPETEARVERALGVLLESRTAIVIAHRLQTAKRADRVVVVDAGKIIEVGTHDELVATGGSYAQLRAVWEHTHTG